MSAVLAGSATRPTTAVAAAPVRARLLYTHFPHMGAHAGMRQLARALDPAVVRAALRRVSDGDDDFPIRHPAVRDRLRRLMQRRGMAWYKLSDLAAELRELPGCVLGGTDVVHFLDGEHTAQLLPAALRIARRAPAGPARRVRTVATFHQPPEMLDDLLDRAAVADLDAVTLVAPTQAAWFRGVLPDDRVEVLLHGVDASFFCPAPGEGRLAGEGRRMRCITVGHWLRDWDLARRVAERLPDVAFDVVTNRPTGLEPLAHVTHHRDVSDERLRELYRRADLLFLPLTGSTANNALLEGMACGLPVVASDLEAVRAYTDGERVGALVRGDDADAFAGAIVEMSDDPVRRGRAGAASRRRAEALAWPVSAPAYARLYRRLLAEAP